MDCPKCNLRYNTVSRRPKVNQCGHTLCQTCCNKLIYCHTCQKIFDKSKSSINYSLMEMLQEKKDTKDIDKLIKVCFIGESSVGKTSLINRLKGEAYKESTITTIGYDFAFEDRQIDGLNIRFQLWDSAGQQRYRAISPLHYKNSDIIIIVYDATKNGKINNISHWIEEANFHCPQNVVKLLVGNKIDLLEDMQTVPFNPLDSIAWKTIAEQKISKYELSCKTYMGIEQFWGVIDKTVRNILKRIHVEESPFKKPGDSSPIEPKFKKRPSSKTEATRLSRRPAPQSKAYQQQGCSC